MTKNLLILLIISALCAAGYLVIEQNLSSQTPSLQYSNVLEDVKGTNPKSQDINQSNGGNLVEVQCIFTISNYRLCTAYCPSGYYATGGSCGIAELGVFGQMDSFGDYSDYRCFITNPSANGTLYAHVYCAAE